MGKKYRNWTIADWPHVIFSDESNIELFGRSGAQFVRHRPGEAYQPDCIMPTVKFGGSSLMIWGCMSSAGTGEIFFCEGRMNSNLCISMLQETLEPSVLKLFDNYPV